MMRNADDSGSRTVRSLAAGTETDGPEVGQQPGHDLVPGATRREVVKAAAGASAVGFGLASGATGPALGGVPTPRLHTDGRWIRDPNGNPVKLRGVAPADPGFYQQHHPKTFEEVLEWLTDESRDWYPNTVRLPCTQDSIDSLGLETFVTEVLRPAVDLLATRGVYALVDFHLIRPYTQEATESADEDYAPIDDVVRNFWSRVAPEFAGDEHVIFELFNEPTEPAMWSDDEGAWQTWRDAAQPWVDLVQDHAPETPLIIGSPRWTSVTHMAPEYPFEGENLIYAAHIYPDNGAPAEFDETYGQPATDVPVVVTEFGWEPDSGDLDQGTTSGWGEPFREWVESYPNMGWIAWCFDDSWAPTFFDSPGQGGNSDWTLKDDPEQMGGYVKQWLAETRDQDIPGQAVDDDTPPPAPSNLTVPRTTEIGVELAWNGVTDRGDADTAGVSHYNVYVDGERRETALGGTTEAAVQGMEPRSTYEIGVTAVDDVGNESPAITTDVQTIATDARQTPSTDHSVPGTIQAEDFDEGGQGIAYYDTTPENQAGADYRSERVDIGTSADSGYNVGYIEAGEWLEYTVDVEVGGTYVAFVTAASGDNQGGSFRLEVDRSEVATQDVWHTGGWSNWQEIRIGEVDLPAGEHVLRVVAEDGGWNVDSLRFEGRDTGENWEQTAPTAPGNLAVTDTSPSSVAVTWESASDASGAAIDHYTVSVDGSLDQQAPAGTTEATIADLAADGRYEIAVRAVGADGTESVAATVAAQTDATGTDGDTTPPTTPADLRVTETATGSLSLAWEPSSDTGSGLAHYVIYVDGTRQHTVGAETTSTTLLGLSAGSAYNVAVAAVDAAGNESSTATVTARTDDTGSDGSTGDTGSNNSTGDTGSDNSTGDTDSDGDGSPVDWWGSDTGSDTDGSQSDSGGDTGGGGSSSGWWSADGDGSNDLWSWWGWW